MTGSRGSKVSAILSLVITKFEQISARLSLFSTFLRRMSFWVCTYPAICSLAEGSIVCSTRQCTVGYRRDYVDFNPVRPLAFVGGAAVRTEEPYAVSVYTLALLGPKLGAPSPAWQKMS